jgi:hypothetical protein
MRICYTDRYGVISHQARLHVFRAGPCRRQAKYGLFDSCLKMPRSDGGGRALRLFIQSSPFITLYLICELRVRATLRHNGDGMLPISGHPYRLGRLSVIVEGNLLHPSALLSVPKESGEALH